MTAEQTEAYKKIIGDGQAHVTISRELSEANYGSGGKVFISVTLTCDQSQSGLQAGVDYAKNIADFFINQHFHEMRKHCYDLHLLVPSSSP